MNVDDLVIQNLDQVKIPKFYKGYQKLNSKENENIIEDIKKDLKSKLTAVNLEPGSKIAVAAGSRGIDKIYEVTEAVIEVLKSFNLSPFIIPAMGSHGGATPEGQIDVLADYGISEENLNVPVRASLETRVIGKTSSNIEVRFSKVALESDGIIVINRVKVHTDFSAEIESGMSKMLVIGLGKHQGASNIHSQGVDKFPEILPEAAQIIIDKAPVLFGLGLLENAVEKLCDFRIASADQIIETDKELLKKQKELLPEIPFAEVDLLIVDEIGKNISGSGMDTNIIGKTKKVDVDIGYIFVRSITDESHGNAIGIGMADFTTKQCYDRINFKDMYTNVLTARMLQYGRIPIVLKDEYTAIKTAILFSNKDIDDIKIVKIKNTLELEEIYFSNALLNEAENDKDISICDGKYILDFNNQNEFELNEVR